MELIPSVIFAEETVEPTWLVHQMFPRGTLIALVGEAGAGKSYLSYYLSYCVALGRPFLGFSTVQTPVLYFDEENSRPDAIQYQHWVWRALGCPEPALLDPVIHPQHLALLAGWKGPMAALATKYRPGLIVVDTATPALHIQDENDNAEATQAIQSLRGIQDAAGNETTILILKHEREKKEGHGRSVRGAKTWLGAVDQVVYHARLRGKPRADGLFDTLLTPEKHRAFALRHRIRIQPNWTDDTPQGLNLQGFQLDDA